MFGGELRDNDEWTLSLLTNEEVLRVHQRSYWNRQLLRQGDHIVWTAKDEDGSDYLAVFNIGTEPAIIRTELELLQIQGSVQVRDLWQRTDLRVADTFIVSEVPAHGVRFYKLFVS